MLRYAKRVSRKVGLSPGSLVAGESRRTGPITISVIDYSERHFEEKQVSRIEDVFPYRDTPGVTWINIDGIHDLSLIEKIGSHFGFHPLVLEDIVTTGQRPKVEDFGDYLFITLIMLEMSASKNVIEHDEVSILVGRNYLLSFQETSGDCFNPIRERLRAGKEKLRKAGPDYLAYALMDTIVDNYFVVLEKLGEHFETLQEKVVADPTPAALSTINRLKGEMLFLRKAVWPLRDVISNLQRGESPLFTRATELYLRDVHDHVIQVMDTIETFRDMLSGMLDIYLSSVSNRLNSVMKVLTIIATIFIPLTFIAGIYGMNFDFMPELHWRFGYPLIMFLMFGIGIGMLAWFRRKNWL
ncbi:MAG: magnesium/cobalt transporter CorA [Candidatus Zixiibacteriota bacterium]